MTTLTKVEFLKREALSQAILNYFEHLEEPEKQKQSQLQAEFIDHYQNVEFFTDKLVLNFLLEKNLPLTLLDSWHKILNQLLEPLIQQYLHWLRGEHALEFTHSYSEDKKQINKWLEEHPDFVEYANVDIRDMGSIK